jgi:hypothetical protein
MRRHVVLEKGGSQDEMKTLEFLGRKPSTNAFLPGARNPLIYGDQGLLVLGFWPILFSFIQVVK